MLRRLLHTYLVRDAGYYPVVTLTGPRQSGKTTLPRAAFPAFDYVTLEDTESRRFAREDPHGFLDRYRPPVIIDEVQRVPDLPSAIQVAVDHPEHTGNYILTGSQNLLLMRVLGQRLWGGGGHRAALDIGPGYQLRDPPATALSSQLQQAPGEEPQGLLRRHRPRLPPARRQR